MNIGDQKATQYLESLFAIKTEMVNCSYKDQDQIWWKSYNKITIYRYNPDNLPKLFALIHPDFYYRIGKSFCSSLPQDKNFTVGIAKNDRCQAKVYTDAECPFNKI